MSKLRLAVLFGSRTCEHDVSIISGLQAAEAAEKAGYAVRRVYIDRQGRWQTGDALKDIAFYSAYDEKKLCRVTPLGEDEKLVLVKYPTDEKHFLRSSRQVIDTLDAVLPVMHGMNGEDGTLQGLLEMLDVPYTSAGVMGSAVGMDKIAMKMLFKGCGFPVLAGEWVERDAWARDGRAVLGRLEKALPYPMFVKPANLGSSIGISRADDRDGLERALDVAAAYDRRILVEEGVRDPREVNCAVLGYGSDIRASILEMPMRWEKMLLDFDEKYLRQAKGGEGGMASLARQIPAPIGEAMTEKVRALSLDVFRAMDLKGVVRIDYILDGDKLYLNEVNTIPGSLAFYLWEPVGVSFSDMIDTMVRDAFKAHADKHKSVFSFDSSILQSQLRGGAKGAKGAKR